jgi:5-methylcytosine-specific restriction endonuclease McrA
LQREHVIAIASGGADCPENVVPACGRCNASKGKKLLVLWAFGCGSAAS